MELRAAIIDYCLRHEIPLPNADIEDIKVKRGQNDEMSVSITYKSPAKGRVVTINQARLGAALINYCRLLKIPLPKAGLKSLGMSKQGVVLMARIDRTPRKKA